MLKGPKHHSRKPSHTFLRVINVVTGSVNNQALKFGTNFMSQNREELAHCCRKFPAGRMYKLNRTERGDAPQFQPPQPLLPGSGLPCFPKCHPARRSFPISVAGGTLVISHSHLIYTPVFLWHLEGNTHKLLLLLLLLLLFPRH